jgi:hypothetical protein
VDVNWIRLAHRGVHWLSFVKRRQFNTSTYITAWFQVSVSVEMRSSLFWDLLSLGWLFVTNYSGQKFVLPSRSTSPLKMRPIYCPEISTVSYQPTLRKIPELRRSDSLLWYQLTYNAFCNEKLQQGKLCFSCLELNNVYKEINLSASFKPS